MIPAIVNGKLSRATPGARGECPECGDGVYARIPDHAIRHWAHIPLPDGEERNCTTDAGEMTEWHRAWQDKRTDPEFIEFCRERPPAPRTDVLNLGGFAIEFQHSPISPEDVARREQYWGKGIWVLDGTPNEDEPRVELRMKPDQDPEDPWRIFRWRRAPVLLWRAKWPCWIDLGGRLLQVRQLRDRTTPLSGDGWIVTADWFVDQVINGKRPTLRPHRYRSAAPPKGRRGEGSARAESDEDLEVMPSCTRAVLEGGQSWRDAAGCASCGRPLFLIRPGRDTCAACQPSQVLSGGSL